MTAIRLLMTAALLAGSAFAQTNVAGTLEIAPVHVQMTGDERAASLTVRNLDKQPTILQLRALDWSQADGEDRFVPSKALLLSPPMATLRPGQTQVIRVLVDGVSDLPAERAFRLVIDQIPDARADPNARTRTAIRVQIPVFVSRSARDGPQLGWEARRSGNALVVTAVNTGSAHDHIVELRVSASGAPLGAALEGYVLGQARRSWTISDVPSNVRSVRIRGEGDYGKVEANVPVAG
jgi:fimbrial chaperone protein